ncbi:MAG: hypothetical protein A2270_07380 [Elusimicrobia bacterium RIFOXYA12_FULL_51_18]|nr:MAG: hypothetical protein A2270_07380 [Elusimicrobia bacterium RIFOXYA12_FULL_51_18]OGS28503.1 MAG: hypothetical protein A2218_05685 [Elusimicrobia bacterium RIFOXYA2_FULL_53_38]
MNVDIRRQIAGEEFDYQTLMALLSAYSNPAMKICALIKAGDIIRVKKGLYVFGERHRRRPYSMELLANLIYGPSMVSSDYMLAHYGLIPEAVYALTSATFKRPKTFNTPLGVFMYKQAPARYYPVGMRRIEFKGGAFLAASPERALADKIREDAGNILNNQKEAERYLFEDLRLDEEGFFAMDAALLEECARLARSRKIKFCAAALKKRKMNK